MSNDLNKLLIMNVISYILWEDSKEGKGVLRKSGLITV